MMKRAQEQLTMQTVLAIATGELELLRGVNLPRMHLRSPKQFFTICGILSVENGQMKTTEGADWYPLCKYCDALQEREAFLGLEDEQ